MTSVPTITSRHRERLSCVECRRRKLRCDRVLPCSRCSRRGEAASCAYNPFPTKIEAQNDHRAQAKERLEHLEQLVQQLVSEKQQHGAADNRDENEQGAAEKRSNNALIGRQSSPGLVHNGSTAWSAMLQDISELKNSIMAVPEPAGWYHEDSASTSSDKGGIGILFADSTSIDIRHLLETHLPPRQEADRLVSAYFRSQVIVAPFLHASQFQRQYASFWDDPAAMSPLWTSMLFSIFHIASKALRVSASRHLTGDQFSVAAGHCLAIGEYFRPQRHAVEALVLYSNAQCFNSIRLPPEMGTVLGILVRLATSMGYHRDPSKLAIPPFEQEMRRRAWSLTIQLDLLVSFHFGLPNCIYLPSCDVPCPRNLLDTDFDETSAALPLDRPFSEPTGVLFYIAKHKFSVVFDKILRDALGSDDKYTNIDRVNSLDAEVRAQYVNVPDVLRPKAISQSVVDPPSFVATRICLSFVYNKCLIVLHRPHVLQHRKESIEACFEASESLVRPLVDAYSEFQPGGRLESERWLLGGIGWNDFMLGVTGLCLVLWVRSDANALLTVNWCDVSTVLQGIQNIFSDQAIYMDVEMKRALALVQATLRFAEQRTEMPGYTTETRVHRIPVLAPDPAMPSEASGFQDHGVWDVLPTETFDSAMWDYLSRHMDFASEGFIV